MCGIVGLFLKDDSLSPQLGGMLSEMLVTMTDRGPDSAGIALYGASQGSSFKVTVQSDDPTNGFNGLAKLPATTLAPSDSHLLAATKLRRAAEGASPPPARPSRSPARQRKAAKSSPRVAAADGFGARWPDRGTRRTGIDARALTAAIGARSLQVARPCPLDAASWAVPIGFS